MLVASKRIKNLALLLALTVLGLVAHAQNTQTTQTTTRLLRQPDVSRTSVVFVYGGDLWLVPRSGGTARRLTANPSLKRYPKFSPDGKWIAFTGNYDGNGDVYIIPAEGGEPKRLTYHPLLDEVIGWTPDSRAVLFRSARTSFSNRFSKLFTVPLTGGLEHELPLPEAGLASYSPDGNQIAYNRIEREFATWKRYRGGLQSYVSLFDLKNNHYSELPHTDATDFYPMWYGDNIYFASDRTNTVNLFSYDLRSKATKQWTHFTDYDVKWPSLGYNAIVFEHGGALNILDLQTEKVTPLSVDARSDLTATRPEWRHVQGSIRSADISPSGARMVFEAWGELFTVPAKKGDSRNITHSPGVREMSPAWSPDGKYIAYLSDRTGEYEICYRPQDGSGTETQLTTGNSIYVQGLAWSLDSKSLLYADVSNRLWRITLADKKPILIDSDEDGISMGQWSSDNRWIVYTRGNPNHTNGIVLYSVDQSKTFVVSDGHFNDREPVFDLNGKYLYFLSDRTFVSSLTGLEFNFDFQNTTGIYALTLQADTPNPLGPESDEEKPKEEKPKTDSSKTDSNVKIDLDGLYHRVITLPVSPGNYQSLGAGKDKLFYLSPSSASLHEYNISERSDSTIISGIQEYYLTYSASKIAYHAGATYGIIDPTPNNTVGTGKLTIDLAMRTDPRAEWKEIFWDSWRLERDYFYDPHMKGLDWKAIGDRYAKLLPDVTDRDDLTYLIGEMIGELNTSHSYAQGAGNPVGPQVNVGLLGVDFDQDNGFYRFKKIYAGENWDSAHRSPLTEPGVKVKQGDYLIAVNGTPLRTDTNPFAPFENTVGKIVTLRINDKPSETGAWDIQVRPIDNDTPLRNLDWVEGNRRRVEAATGGRVGYIYVPDTGLDGIAEFGKGFYAQTDKDAVIVDERFNSGGFVPAPIIERLGRKRLYAMTPRYGTDSLWPTEAIYGPKVMLANEWSGSGGDSFPYMFRRAGLGPIIGKRTWGGLVGITGFRPLMDGGGVSVPEFGFWSPEENKWIAENHGIDPDIEVNNTPELMNQGHDPQLERAIDYILDQLKKNPPHKPVHPPFPVEKLPPPGP